MLAMRLGFAEVPACAVGFSITAAMVIAEPTSEIVYNFRLWPTFAGKCQQRVITMPPRRGTRGRIRGRDVDVGHRVFAAGADGARLFQLLCAAEDAVDRRRRRRAAVRARAATPRAGISTAQIPRNHPAISGSNHPGAETLEVRHRLDGRGVPPGSDAASAPAICQPDLRRRLQGYDDVGLSGAVPAR